MGLICPCILGPATDRTVIRRAALDGERGGLT